MTDTETIVAYGGGCAIIVDIVGLIFLWAMRGRSLRIALFTLALSSVLATLAGTIGASSRMFTPTDFHTVVTICAVAGPMAVIMALLLARAMVADSRTLRTAVRTLGAGYMDPPRRRPAPTLKTAEMEELHHELAVTSRRLNESRERERALERSRRELVAWVSHDLRTPLAGLRAMVEALEDGLAAEPARYHAQMRMAVDRLSGMVDDLFELSRIHAGALSLSLEWVALQDLVDEAVAGVDPLARARGVRLGAKILAPVAVQADMREMSRALTNLVVNAVRHTPADGSVIVEAGAQAGHALLAVTDACGGIPAEDLRRVFEVGWRGTPARTPEPDSGAGLGLAIVRGIVEAHAGVVDVRNTEFGCRFEVRLPVPVGGPAR